MSDDPAALKYINRLYAARGSYFFLPPRLNWEEQIVLITGGKPSSWPLGGCEVWLTARRLGYRCFARSDPGTAQRDGSHTGPCATEGAH
jgi:hypothetical protein